MSFDASSHKLVLAQARCRDVYEESDMTVARTRYKRTIEKMTATIANLKEQLAIRDKSAERIQPLRKEFRDAMKTKNDVISTLEAQVLDLNERLTVALASEEA